jgi:AraC-like DNA-binding protein
MIPSCFSARSAAADLDILGSIRLMLRAYLAEKHLDVNLVAEIAGMSVRSLQRRLAQYELSYSRLLEQVRFEAAADMLNDPDLHLTDIAYAVGFEHPTHFSRAFRRIAGLSPREYRKYNS